MDCIVVKNQDKATLIQDLEETFTNLRKISLKLNPEKCVFGVPSGKLLGFFVSQRVLASRSSLVTPSGRLRCSVAVVFPLGKIPRIESPETPSFNKKVSIANGAGY